MECKHVKTRLPALLDGDLAPASRYAVEEHLAECPDCAADREALEMFLCDAAQALACPAPVPAFAQLSRQLHLVDPIDELVAFLPRLKIGRAVPRMIVASILLLFAGGGQYLLRGTWHMLSQGQTSVASHRVELDERLADALDPGRKTGPDRDTRA